MADPGFEIGDRHYPFVTSFRFGDTVLVAQVTGMDWDEFADALNDPDRQTDPVVVLGAIAAAVWQGNPRWTRDRVARYVEALQVGEVQAVGEDGDADDPPVDPPAVPAGEPSEPKENSAENGNGEGSESPALTQSESLA